jgi:hypothetical protein
MPALPPAQIKLVDHIGRTYRDCTILNECTDVLRDEVEGGGDEAEETSRYGGQ